LRGLVREQLTEEASELLARRHGGGAKNVPEHARQDERKRDKGEERTIGDRTRMEENVLPAELGRDYANVIE
jgi:hypothetical protein